MRKLLGLFYTDDRALYSDYILQVFNSTRAFAFRKAVCYTLL